MAIPGNQLGGSYRVQSLRSMIQAYDSADIEPKYGQTCGTVPGTSILEHFRTLEDLH